MVVAANPTLEGAPYGAQPVLPVTGDAGGPYTIKGYSDQQALGSAARTATTSSGTFNPLAYKGMYVWFNVTVNPGGAQTLALSIDAVNPTDGSFTPLFTLPASATPGGVFLVYPGAGNAAIGGIPNVFGAPIPKRFRVTVTHSGAGAWTYSVWLGFVP